MNGPRIAVVPGDGIGREVVPAALRVLDRVGEALRLGLRLELFDWGAQRWLDEGVGLPDGAAATLRREYDAVFLGALGDPRIPDMAHGREILLGLRRGLDVYVNHRPIVLPTGTIDLYRENTQGLYAGVGGTVRRGELVEVAVDESVYTRDAVERFVRYCLADLRRRGRGRVTLVHKANAVPNTGRLWQEVFHRELAGDPALSAAEEYVDAFCYHLVRDPARYEGVLTANLFGDIAADVGAALMGGLGFAASASICPETGQGLFEPVHGSAPDIAGTGRADPYAAIMSAVLMLEHLAAAHGPAFARAARLVRAALPPPGTADTIEGRTTAVLARLELELDRGGAHT